MLERPASSCGTAPSPHDEKPPAGTKISIVVGVGASAGGLEACIKFMQGLPALGSGMALILVQHLDPKHESMMVDLLAGRSAMTVRQAENGMHIEPEHLYIIPPGSDLSASDGMLHVAPRKVPRSAHLPFDLLLRSLAEAYGSRAACVVLSGTGADGSAGLLAIKRKGGFVAVQRPEEAGYPGMPNSAIQTGQVDLVAPAAAIADALVDRLQQHADAAPPAIVAEPSAVPADRSWLPQIVELLRTDTAHDFTLYKPGTLERRVERRMAMAAIRPNDMGRYLETLLEDRSELELLAKDLLINVTSFFRDPDVFETLATTIIPKLVENHPLDRPLRLWVAGCSTGEETYSLAMLFQEEIAASGRSIKLQVFASDVDADAVLVARDGTYPDAVAHALTPERLTRFFSREEGRWRVNPVLRGMIVFTVQDVLADPPFSRLDMVSCRNLLIYLQPDAQGKALAQFHFALREGGILLLGSAETAGSMQGRFEVVAKSERIYRRVGQGRSDQTDASVMRPASAFRTAADHSPARPAPRPAALAELGRRLVIETYAPASMLVNAANEILFSLGPVDRYLHLAPGYATHDILLMARAGLRSKLHSAIQSARQTNKAGSVSCHMMIEGKSATFNVEVRPVSEAGNEMLLVSFVHASHPATRPDRPIAARHVPRITELEHELETTRTELQALIRTLELNAEEQRAINEEALSVNEEYQSTNEEQLASKEELQSMNEELTALNSQLQETLERQRTTSDDLQNVLYSTNVATLFLDLDMRIRFFTPATTALFPLIASDVGRPLSTFAAMAPDSTLESDARAVLDTLGAEEREIEAKNGAWFRRRILPYRTHNGRVGGVVITFIDITARKTASKALEIAKKEADSANATKSRFLAAASHDLRQPLQTLALLQALLAKVVEGEKATRLVVRLDNTLAAMTDMLDALLDINDIEAGSVRAQITEFPIGRLLEHMREAFAYHAEAKGLELRVVTCSLMVRSDPRLLEQMVRNLIANALKYTARGTVLLGCRRRGGSLSVEVWDTGIGIPEAEREAIFEEYYQLGNAARERSRGLGLGLSVVRRLGGLLDHRVQVRSRPGVGSGFSIEVPLVIGAAPDATGPLQETPSLPASDRGRAILVIEDDPDLRGLLALLLEGEGHRVTTALDGATALDALQGNPPDLVLADHNLPNGLTGLDVAVRIRRQVGADLPVLILTGDISTATQAEITGQACALLHKPVHRAALLATVNRLLSPAQAKARIDVAAPGATTGAVVFVVDDDEQIRQATAEILQQDGHTVLSYASSEAFLKAYKPGSEACLLVDAYLPGMDGFELLAQLRSDGHSLPAIMITGHSDVRMAVRAMRAGASDFIEKPIAAHELVASIGRALDQARDVTKRSDWHEAAANNLAGLTVRQRQVMTLVLAGQPSKNIAADLGISQRTVENHRASVMRKTGASSLPALARLAIAASPGAATERLDGALPALGTLM